MLKAMVLRNIKLYFKDKGMFFTSLITPAILAGAVCDVSGECLPGFVYRKSSGRLFAFSKADRRRCRGAAHFFHFCGQLRYCAVLFQYADGTGQDHRRPEGPAHLAGKQCGLVRAAISWVRRSLRCWYALRRWRCVWDMCGRSAGSFPERISCCCSADIVLLVLFGTALSSLIHFFLSTQGQISAVGTLVSAGYGFLCGAYMPISSYGSGLQKVLSFLPSTYMTALVRNHTMRGVLAQMETDGVPKALVVSPYRESLDCTVKFAGKNGDRPCHVCVYRRRSSGAAGRISCRALSGRKETSPFMKVTIENLPPGEEAEIIIRANTLSQRVMNLLHATANGERKTDAVSRGWQHERAASGQCVLF